MATNNSPRKERGPFKDTTFFLFPSFSLSLPFPFLALAYPSTLCYPSKQVQPNPTQPNPINPTNQSVVQFLIIASPTLLKPIDSHSFPLALVPTCKSTTTITITITIAQCILPIRFHTILILPVVVIVIKSSNGFPLAFT